MPDRDDPTATPGVREIARQIGVAQPMANPTRAIAVNSEGLVMVTMLGGQKADVFIAPGAPIPIRVLKVWATGTTA